VWEEGEDREGMGMEDRGENLILHPSLFLSVGLISPVYRFLDLFAHRFFNVLVLFLYILVIPHVRQTKLASSLVNF